MTVDPAVAGPPAVVPVVDVDLIAAAVRRCPSVAALHGGRFGEVATYLPGRRVRGVRVTATAVEVHVVGRFPATMPDIAAQVRGAVAPWAAGRPVDVTIEDLVVGAEPFAEPADPSTAAVITVDTSSVVVVADDMRAGSEPRES